ncbi:hypothetical protein HaLaN_00669 [Haematococcus lacustris]|uniref:Uncharacterized protein n=1 Tax=Haematococcus lacustris TaxID=44745 RepID=A0A699YGF0_HAELA|nr:hypothetical protein HaLaN_00669 [Haematococcus lacustris]
MRVLINCVNYVFTITVAWLHYPVGNVAWITFSPSALDAKLATWQLLWQFRHSRPPRSAQCRVRQGSHSDDTLRSATLGACPSLPASSAAPSAAALPAATAAPSPATCPGHARCQLTGPAGAAGRQAGCRPLPAAAPKPRWTGRDPAAPGPPAGLPGTQGPGGQRLTPQPPAQHPPPAALSDLVGLVVPIALLQMGLLWQQAEVQQERPCRPNPVCPGVHIPAVAPAGRSNELQPAMRQQQYIIRDAQMQQAHMLGAHNAMKKTGRACPP